MIKDPYLKKFVNYCKEKFGENLEAIVIFGSYALGFFDKKKSDYDVIIIFKNKIPRGKEEIKKRFPKIVLHHFLTDKNLLKKIYEGHWSIYMTLLKSAKVLYKREEYDIFLEKLKKINFWKDIDNLDRIKFKDEIDKKHLNKTEGYAAVKKAFASIRKRLQILTHLRKKKLMWGFNKNLRVNKQFLNKKEIFFLKNLNKKNFSRSNKFGIRDKEIALRILDKLIREIGQYLPKELT